MNKVNKKNQEGFSLVEILLALAILSVIIVFIGMVYVNFTNIQTRSKSSQEVLNSANFVLEMMSRELRNSVIYDYNLTAADCNAYLGNEYDSCILFKRPNGQLAAFARTDPDYVGGIYPDLIYIILDCGPVYGPKPLCDWDSSNYDAYTDLFLTSSNNIQVEDLNFYISPNTDPYDDESVNQQPKVTINMLINYYDGKKIGQVTQQLQTTVSTRVFSR